MCDSSSDIAKVRTGASLHDVQKSEIIFNRSGIMDEQSHLIEVKSEVTSGSDNSTNSTRSEDLNDLSQISPATHYDLILDMLYDEERKKLIPEDDDYGNIEYKRRLDKKDKKGLNTMVMQMMTRMARGHMKNGVWETHYVLGVDDDGEFSGLKKREVIHTSKILRAVVAGAYGKIVSEKIYEFAKIDGTPSFVMHVHIKREFKIEQIPESTIYFMGPTGVSKTSILSNLAHGQMDNARGLSRELSLRHVHEKASGITSSSKFETIGSNGESIVNYEISITSDAMEAICSESQILFNLVDLPGDIRYSKTMCHSLLTLAPELIMLCVPIDNPVEYIESNAEVYNVIFRVCAMFKIQPLIVFTKSDLIEDSEIIHQKKTAMTHVSEKLDVLGVDSQDLDCIAVNNVRPNGISELENYLVSYGNSIIDSYNEFDDSDDDDEDLLYRVHDVFEVPSIGTVIHGVVLKGVLNTGDIVKVVCNGKVMERKIRSIHRKAMDAERLNEGETGSIMITGKCDRATIDKTTVITNDNGLQYLSSIGYVTSVAGEKILPKQYVMFAGNNIIAVLLKETENPNVFSFKTYHSTDILIDVQPGFSVPGILRDETRSLTFVRVMANLPITDNLADVGVNVDVDENEESSSDGIW